MFLLSFLEAIFSVLVLGIIGLFFVSLVFSWSWAQQKGGAGLRWVDILSAAAVEWGAFLSLLVAHLRRPRSFFEAPPLGLEEASPQQLPVIFVPSLHTRSSIFGLLFWRLKKNFWNSLWAFDWKAFLHDPELLEDQLRCFVDEVISKTEARRFRIVSFGSSRPIVSRVLDRQDLRAYCDRWVAISAPAHLSAFFRFLATSKLRRTYESSEEIQKNPDIVIHGENDFFCFPSEVFGSSRKTALPNVGHYSSLLHSTTTQTVMKELS